MSAVRQDLRVVAAQAEADRARERMLATARELAQLLAPRKIAHDVWRNAKVKGADLAEDAVDAVKRRPVAVTGVIAAAAMFLAREPISQGIVKLYDAMTSGGDDEPEKPRPPRKSPPRRRQRKTEKT